MVHIFSKASSHLVITGRAKDTIVLRNGENISPVRVEDILLTASQNAVKDQKGLEPLVEQIMVFGQDRPWLGALVVTNPMQLEQRGYLSHDEVHEITNATAKIAAGEDADAARMKLRQFSQLLADNDLLKKAIEKEWTEVS